MSVIDTVEKKNEVILSRFETKEAKGIMAFRVTMQNGKSFNSICSNGSSEDIAISDIYMHFGRENIKSVVRSK